MVLLFGLRFDLSFLVPAAATSLAARAPRRVLVCALLCCCSAAVLPLLSEYRLVAKKGEGTFSEVLKAQSLITGEYFAIKCMKSRFKNLDQVNSLREIQALRRLNPYPNIIDLEEVLYDKATGRLALVFELMDQNVYELIRGRKQSVKATTIKLLMYQLLKAVAHMHKHGIFHRDIKPEVRSMRTHKQAPQPTEKTRRMIHTTF